MRIKQMDGSIYDSRANENLRATVAEQAAQHSPKFEDIKGYYDSGFWNAAMVKNAVKKKRITAEEYTEITGKEYK